MISGWANSCKYYIHILGPQVVLGTSRRQSGRLMHRSFEIRKSEEQIFSKTLGQHLKVIDAGTVVYIFLVK